MSAPSITPAELAELLVEAGHRHHEAYAVSDGADPEWLWYAGYVQAQLWDRGGSLPSRSLLVHLLLSAEADFATSGESGPWEPHYAQFMLDRLSVP